MSRNAGLIHLSSLALLAAIFIAVSLPNDEASARTLPSWTGPHPKVQGPRLAVEEETPAFHRDHEELSITRAGLEPLLGENGRALLFGHAPFVAVGLMGEGAALAEMRYRALLTGGAWSSERRIEITWRERDAFVARLPIDGTAVAIELVSPDIGAPDFLFLEFMEERPDWSGPLARDLPLEAASAQKSSSFVVTRSAWGARAPSRTPCGAWHSPRHLTIHHTATPNNDSLSPAARMRQMQSYHMDNLGWCDIGYHFVVGGDGRVYRGRQTEQRTGAHVGNHNTNNVGVSVMGNFTSVSPSALQLEGLQRIGAWLTSQYSIPLNRTRIHGHRDWSGHSWNACPGNILYGRLDSIIAGFGQEAPPSCENECAAGSRRCVSDTRYEVCGDYDGNGCTSWGGARDCGCGEFCEGGACIRDPSICCPAPIAGGSDRFADVLPGSWQESVAVRLADLGITEGCATDPPLFCPQCWVTRGQSAAFLARGLQLEKITNDPPTFEDVPTTHSFHGYVEALYAEGLIHGCATDPLRFCPSDPMMRGTSAGLLGRASNLDIVAAATPVFSDVSEDAWYRPALETAHRLCIVSGCSTEPLRFCPGDAATRAQFGAMLLGFLELDEVEVAACCNPAAIDGATGHFHDMAEGREETAAAEALFDAGITNGCRGGETPLFCGICPLDRGAGAAFLARTLGLEEIDVEAPTFSDVPLDHRFSAEIEALAAHGLVTGCDPEAGLFCPADLLPRATAASLIARTLQVEVEDLPRQSFSDVSEAAWYADAVTTLAAGCVLDGCGGDDFCPGRPVLREDFALWLVHAFGIGGFENCLPHPEDETDEDVIITFPNDGAVLDYRDLTVWAGCSAPGLERATINDTEAEMFDGGVFAAVIELSMGENVIEAVAYRAGDEEIGRASITVTYSGEDEGENGENGDESEDEGEEEGEAAPETGCGCGTSAGDAALSMLLVSLLALLARQRRPKSGGYSFASR